MLLVDVPRTATKPIAFDNPNTTDLALGDSLGDELPVHICENRLWAKAGKEELAMLVDPNGVLLADTDRELIRLDQADRKDPSLPDDI